MLALVVVTCIAYAGSLDTPLLLDDPTYITKSAAIRRTPSLIGLLLDPRAVVSLSLRWNYLSGGVAVEGYHLLNLLAHAATSLVVFLLAFATLKLPVFETRYDRAAPAAAATVAALFALHPIQTESVTYIIQRAEVFVSFGILACLLALARMRERSSAVGLTLLAVASLVGAYSKPSFVVAPVVMAVYDLCFLSRGRWRELRLRWPVYAVAAATAALTLFLTTNRGSFGSETAGFEIEGIAPLDYLASQFGVIVYYLWVVLWPTDLCFDCGYRGPWPVLASPLGDSVAVPLAILVALAVAGLATWKRYPFLAFAVFASGIALAPTSSFVPLSDFYVEHRMYLPVAFVALALVPVFADAGRSLVQRFSVDRVAVAWTGRVLAVVVCGSLTVLTAMQNELLGDPIALLEDALATAPQNERAHYNLANAYKRRGDLDLAIPHYKAAIELRPNVARSYMNLGGIYLNRGDALRALEIYRAGAENNPKVAMAHRNVATALLRVARWEEALAAADASLAIEPNSVNGRKLRATALDKLGRSTEAIEDYRKVLAANPRDENVRARLRAMGAL